MGIVEKNENYKPDLFNIPYGNKIINATTEIEFPLYLKNEKETIFWRYHEDGRYEVFTFGKNSHSFSYGRNEYWTDNERVFDRVFMIRQVQNNIKITEEDFLKKSSDFFNQHAQFLGNENQYDIKPIELVDEPTKIIISDKTEEDF